MTDNKQKIIRQINVNSPEVSLSIIIEDEMVYISKYNSPPEYMNTVSDLLYCLIRNLGYPVDNATLNKYAPQDITRKTFLNYFSSMKALFGKDGEKIIQTTGQGSKYKVAFKPNEHCEILYSDDEYALAPDYFRQLTSSEGSFESVEEITGGRAIRSPLLPVCLCGGIQYTTLSQFVCSVFMRNLLQPSLILHADGGSGKTFSLADTYSLAEKLGFRPIYIHADDLDTGKFNLLRYIAERNLKEYNYNQQRTAFSDFVEGTKYSFLLLIDGLNEVSHIDKLKECCISFRHLHQKYPGRFHGVFATRYPQILKANLYNPQEAALQPLPSSRFRDKKLDILDTLHVKLTPLVAEILENMSAEDVSQLHSRYDLYLRYFDVLAAQADRKDRGGWIYDVLSSVAAKSMEGQTIDSRWLKKFCSADAESDFIHRYCSGEEYPLEESSAIEKLKGTGFLIRNRLDSYTIHHQYRDYLAVRFGLMMIREGEISAADFLCKIVHATRKYKVSAGEDASAMNARRHNNMDLGEFGFYAGLNCYEANPDNLEMIPALVQLGIHIIYLYDNVENWYQIYHVHLHLEPLLQKCFQSGLINERIRASLPGYYYCLNRLVVNSKESADLANLTDWASFSEKIEKYYIDYLEMLPDDAFELHAIALSGIGGVYLDRYKILNDFLLKEECLNQAFRFHSRAMTMRRDSGSDMLHRSLTALGTSCYRKGILYLDNPLADRHGDALKLLQDAVKYHTQAIDQPANREKYISWSRIPGCFYQILKCLPAEDIRGREECISQLYHAVITSCNLLRISIEKNGVARHGGDIRTLLEDISRYMPCLRLDDKDCQHIDKLCDLYHEAFSEEKKPCRSADNHHIVF